MITMLIELFVALAVIAFLVVLFSKRLRNILWGKADRAIEMVEKDDPDALYRGAMADLQKDVAELKQLAVEAKGMVFQTDEAIRAQEEAKATLERDLKLAVEAGKKDLGVSLIEQIDNITAKIDVLKSQRDEYNATADETIDARDKAIKELKDLMAEQAQAKSLDKADKVMDRIRDRKDGIAGDSASRALAAARAKSAAVKAERAAEKTTAASSTDSQIDELRKAASNGDAAARFEAMSKK